MSSLFLVHLACCLCMTGIIWLVQLVHYPLFGFVDQKKFGQFEEQHIRRITWVVAPLMILELGSGLALMILWPETALYFNFGLLVFIWVCTWVFSVPLHRKLSHGYDEKILNRLIRTNWGRTWSWTIRSLTLLLVDFNNA